MIIDHTLFKGKAKSKNKNQPSSPSFLPRLIVGVGSVFFLVFIASNLFLAVHTSQDTTIHYLKNEPLSNKKTYAYHYPPSATIKDTFILDRLPTKKELQKVKNSKSTKTLKNTASSSLSKSVVTSKTVKQAHALKSSKQTKPTTKRAERRYDLPSVIVQKESNRTIIKTTEKIKAALISGINSSSSSKIYARPDASFSPPFFLDAIFIGSLSGISLDRLSISFDKLKLKNGLEISIQAHAIGLDLVPGIKGTLINNSGTNMAKDIAQEAVSFADTAIAGDLLSSAIDSTFEHNETAVVSLEKGTSFYVFFDEDIKEALIQWIHF